MTTSRRLSDYERASAIAEVTRQREITRETFPLLTSAKFERMYEVITHPSASPEMRDHWLEVFAAQFSNGHPLSPDRLGELEAAEDFLDAPGDHDPGPGPTGDESK